MMMQGQPQNWFCLKGLYPLLLGEQACIYAGRLFEFPKFLLHVGGLYFVSRCMLIMFFIRKHAVLFQVSCYLEGP
jgi:hypothetical protein